MPLQERATEVLQTPKLYFFHPFSLPSTLGVANSRYSLSLSLSLLHHILSASPTVSSSLVRQHFLFLPAHILHSDLVFFFLILPSGSLLILALSNGRVRCTRLFPSYRHSLVYSPPSVVFCSIEAPHPHRCLLATSKHQLHVNFIVTVRVANQRGLTCNYRVWRQPRSFIKITSTSVHRGAYSLSTAVAL